MFCPACGAEMAPNAQFCTRCGASPRAPAGAMPGAAGAAPGWAGSGLQPHRGGAVLALGILGIVLCFICGIIAWTMGNNDLREMEAGRMDPSGMSLTKAGKICGMIGTILALIAVGFYALFVCGGLGGVGFHAMR